MGADNWTICPVCAKKDPFIGDDDPTWREDYEIGVNRDGSFDVNYSGGCYKCGAAFRFKREVVDVSNEATDGE